MRKGNQIVGKLKCDECGRVNEWYYVIPDNINAPKYNTFIIDPTKAGATLIKGDRDKPEELKIACKGCGKDLFFEYQE